MKRRLSDSEKKKVLKRDGSQCRYCGRQLKPNEIRFDHVYPFAKGGETTVENMVVSCHRCNAKKSDKVGVWPMPLTYQRKTVNQLTWLAVLFLFIASATNGIIITTYFLGFWYWSLFGALVITLDVICIILLRNLWKKASGQNRI